MKLLNETKRGDSSGSHILRDTSKQRLNERPIQNEEADGPLPSGVLTPEHKSPTDRFYARDLILDDDILGKLMHEIPLKQQEPVVTIKKRQQKGKDKTTAKKTAKKDKEVPVV